MPIRFCPNCNKSFQQKTHYQYHINPNRKNACLPIVNQNTPICSNLLQDAPICSKLLQNSEEYIDNNYKDDHNEALNCSYCNKKFTRNNNLNRHILYRCKIKKQQEEEKQKIFESLVKQIEELKKEVFELKQNNQVQKVGKIKPKTINNGPINNGTVNNNGAVNNGAVNNGTVNNIILVAHGSEDMSKINLKDILKSLNSGYMSIPELVKNVHFNIKYPEYHNVYISNMRDKYVMVYDGNKWNLTDRKEVLNDIYDNKKYILEDNFEKFYKKLNKKAKERFDKFIEDSCEPQSVAEKNAKEEIKKILYNYRQIPINTIDSKQHHV